MHHRQMKKKFRAGDTMDPKDLDHRVTCVYSYRALPHPSGSQLSEVFPRLVRLLSTQSVPSLEVFDMDEGCWITHTLPHHVVALHQQVHPPWVSTTESRCSLTSPSPCMWILTASPALTEEVAQSQVRNAQIHL